MLFEAVILAAGIGNRLSSVTGGRPKCLTEVAPGVAILDQQISAVLALGMPSRFIITVGYEHGLVEEYARTRYPDLPFAFLLMEDFATTNTARSLGTALAQASPKHAILQLNGDVVLDSRILSDARAAIEVCPAGESRIFLREAACGEEEMKLVARADGTVQSISKQEDPARALGEAFGLNFHGARAIREYAAHLAAAFGADRQAYFEAGLNRYIGRGHIARPVPIGNRFATEVDFPEDLARARALYEGVTGGL